jgi:DNA-directed RNA polymerase subunit RPC12/RpoP
MTPEADNTKDETKTPPTEMNPAPVKAGTDPLLIHLIINPTHAGSSVDGSNCFELSRGVSFLCFPPGEPWSLETTSPESLENIVLFEPVIHQSQLRLLIVNPEEAEVRVNDQAAPHAILLRERDQIQINCGPPLEVAVFNRPTIGNPPPDLSGQLCPVCRTPLAEDSRVYVCGNCGTGMHFDESDKEDGLECVLMTPNCPVCSRPVQLQEGYLSEPEFLQGNDE